MFLLVSFTPSSYYFILPKICLIGPGTEGSFVRSPEGNGVIERFFRTLKEQLLWVRHFETVEQVCEALHEFKQRYNEHWIMQRHNYRTPKQVRDEWLADMMTAA